VSRVAVVVLADIAEGHRLWGIRHFLLDRFAVARTPGLTFLKVLGSGRDGGFGLLPSFHHQGLFCVFREEGDADRFLEGSAGLAACRAHAREFFTVKLRAFSTRGTWSGARPFEITTQPPRTGPVAALTRASIRPLIAAQFWHRAPPAEQSLASARGCLLAAGLGEAPLLRQATFTIWESIAAMDAYARTGAHLEAIRAAARGRYFSESMFSRFVPGDAHGTWHGRAAEAIVPRSVCLSLANPAPCLAIASS